MALGFPHNTYNQQRRLTQPTAKTASLKEAQVLNTSLVTLESNSEEVSTQASFLEMLADYLINLFKESISHSRSMAMNGFQKTQCEYFAIKYDFEYQLVG